MSETTTHGVCFVGASVFDPVANSVGGAERQVRLLGLFLAEKGWRVRYTAASALADGIRPESVPGALTVFAGSTRAKRWGWLLSCLGVLLRVPEPILYQRGAGPLTAAAWLAARLSGKRFVWAVASDADLSFVGSLDRAAGRSSAAWLKRVWAWPIERLIDSAIAGADLVLCQHEGQVAEIAKGRRVVAARVHLLRNAVDLEGPPPLPIAERTAVAWVGSIRPGKRPQLFAELASGLSELPFEFVMAGRMYPPCTVDLFPKGPEAENVRYVGELPHDRIVDLMRSARVLVSTSEVEGFPNTWLEAWAVGTPVVSLDLDPGGSIARSGAGWLAHSTAELRDAVTAACGDPAAWQAAADAARGYVASNHAPAVIGERLETLLSQLPAHRTG